MHIYICEYEVGLFVLVCKLQAWVRIINEKHTLKNHVSNITFPFVKVVT